MEYKIVSASVLLSADAALQKLVKAVNEAVALGWEPVGGPSFIHSQVCQALIKRR